MSDLPKDYFKKLPDILKDRIEHLEDNLENSAPILSSLRNQNPYVVPNGYWQSLESRLTQNRKRRKIVPMRWLSIAATFLALGMLAWIFTSQDSPDADAVLLAENEIYEYLIDNVDQLEDDLLTELLVIDEGDEDNLDEDELMIDLLLTDFTESELENLN